MLFVAAVLVLAISACGGTTSAVTTTSSGSTTGSAPTTANAFVLNGEWPLTGETLTGSPPDHPVYVVKIDNTIDSAPQIGLGSADMITEELVEGGLTRLAVFFDSTIPKVVGPVRSMRASDVGIVKPAAATLVASGAAGITLRIISSHKIPYVTEDSGGTGFYRDDSGDRSAPYNLFMKLNELAATAKNPAYPSTSYMQFGSDSDFAGTMPVKSIAAVFSGAHTTSWLYKGGQWTQPDSNAAQGDDFTPDNILLLTVNVGNAGYLDPAGNPVPETEFYGHGKALLVHGDKGIKCHWHKSTRESQLQLTTSDGSELDVPAGKTWIELVPKHGGTISIN